MDTLTRMRAFIDVVDAEGYSAAARKLGRSKALLSKYVKELEDELGALLLNRTTRRQSLTETGQAYYERCRTVLAEAAAADAVASDELSEPRGRLA
jgi:DNA-binding transcriptional LysR family regulator